MLDALLETIGALAVLASIAAKFRKPPVGDMAHATAPGEASVHAAGDCRRRK